MLISLIRVPQMDQYQRLPFFIVPFKMTDYKLYPNLPSAPPENPQVAYHLSIIQAKQRGLKNKEQMFKQKYEKYNKILN